MFSPKMTTTCLITAEEVVGVGGVGGGVVFEFPLPGGLLTVPWPQPLRIRVVDNESASSFRIIVVRPLKVVKIGVPHYF
jgi:hypothetical protein